MKQPLKMSVHLSLSEQSPYAPRIGFHQKASVKEAVRHQADGNHFSRESGYCRPRA